MKQSLTDFAAVNTRKPPGSGAWLESIPEFAEVVEAWKSGVNGGIIRRWLVESKGYPAVECTAGRVNAYLQARYPRG